VFDSNNPGETLGGKPTSVLTLFGDTPRALARSTDGTKVYAAIMHSGNQTTTVGEQRLAKHGPTSGTDGVPAPDTGLIVQFDGSNWRDSAGDTTDLGNKEYDDFIPYTLPDYDVFEISATDNPRIEQRHSGVGTTLFNMAVNPLSGAVYVSNTEALNVNRFEGESHSTATLRGNFIRNRISIIKGDTVSAIELNKHLDRTTADSPAAQKQLTVAQPTGMVVSEDGEKLYVAAFGSQKVVTYNTAALEDNSFTADSASQVILDGGGPTGLTLDNNHNRLYVLTRFNNSVAIIDTDQGKQIDTIPLFNPEPSTVKDGRKFLFDADLTSGHGDASCGTCHVFGDLDSLAWDLGNPEMQVASNPNEFARGLAPAVAVFHPLKGPMTTQSLRGLKNAGPMHWRGDKPGLNGEPGESRESAAFREFNGAFTELLARGAPLSNTEMKQFADYALTLTYPPNPIRALDNSLTTAQSLGRNMYLNSPTTGGVFTCNHCHTLAPEDGHFGTSGLSSVEGSGVSQEFKVPHLRNVYTKVGKFGNTSSFLGSAAQQHDGPQVRGYGFLHDGSVGTLDNFFRSSVFRFSPNPTQNEQERSNVIEFVMAVDSDMAPVVGQQITVSANTTADTDARVSLLIDRATVTSPRPECDLIAKGVVEQEMRGYLMQPNGSFKSDRAGDAAISFTALQAIAKSPNGAITFSCVPPGSGVRLGIDRNQDNTLDGD